MLGSQFNYHEAFSCFMAFQRGFFVHGLLGRKSNQITVLLDEISLLPCLGLGSLGAWNMPCFLLSLTNMY